MVFLFTHNSNAYYGYVTIYSLDIPAQLAFSAHQFIGAGNRPSFFHAGDPEMASRMYDSMIEKCRNMGYKTECGSFGADMKVSLLNDGPFTIVLDSDELLAK